MLNVNYDNPKKLLLSLGVTMVFLGALLFLANIVYAGDLMDQAINDVLYVNTLMEENKINETEAVDFLNETYPEIIEEKTEVMQSLIYTSFILMIVGVILFLIGLVVHNKRWGEFF